MEGHLAQNKPAVKKHISNTGALIVDDYKPSRVLLRPFLIRLGVTKIEEATNSIDALRFIMDTDITQSPFDIIFISLGIREMNGLDLLRNIRQLANWDEFPVVIVAENASADIALEAFSAGATEFLLRPYEEATLARIIAKLHQDAATR